MSTAYPLARVWPSVDSEDGPGHPSLAARSCAEPFVGHSAMRESLFVLSFRSIIPAFGRVCQHLIQAPGESILTLNSSDRVLVPVVDCVRQLFVALEMVMRLTKFEAVVTSSRA